MRFSPVSRDCFYFLSVAVSPLYARKTRKAATITRNIYLSLFVCSALFFFCFAIYCLYLMKKTAYSKYIERMVFRNGKQTGLRRTCTRSFDYTCTCMRRVNIEVCASGRRERRAHLHIRMQMCVCSPLSAPVFTKARRLQIHISYVLLFPAAVNYTAEFRAGVTLFSLKKKRIFELHCRKYHKKSALQHRKVNY